MGLSVKDSHPDVVSGTPAGYRNTPVDGRTRREPVSSRDPRCTSKG